MRCRRAAGWYKIVGRIEGIEKRDRAQRRNDPFCSAFVEVVEDDVDADCLSVPAETVDEVGWHLSNCIQLLQLSYVAIEKLAIIVQAAGPTIL